MTLKRVAVAAGDGSSAATRLRALRGRCRAGLRALLKYTHALTGEGAYRAYLDHHARTHAGTAPLSERDFWREQYAEQDRNPGSRCC